MEVPKQEAQQVFSHVEGQGIQLSSFVTSIKLTFLLTMTSVSGGTEESWEAQKMIPAASVNKSEALERCDHSSNDHH